MKVRSIRDLWLWPWRRLFGTWLCLRCSRWVGSGELYCTRHAPYRPNGGR